MLRGELSCGGQSRLALCDFTWEPRDMDLSFLGMPAGNPESVCQAEHHYAHFTHRKTENQRIERMHELYARCRARLACVWSQTPVGPREVDIILL